MSGQVGLPRRTKSLRPRGSTQDQQTLRLRAAGDLESVEGLGGRATHTDNEMMLDVDGTLHIVTDHPVPPAV
jgi:hypothetical protein